MFDYDVYTLCGDGDMMEGVTSEAASLAGHLMLGNLCWIYDSNRITIEGHTDLAFSDDVAARFLAYGWNVERVGDANDTARIAEAIETFRRIHDVPTLIIVESHIGYGAPHKQDTSAAHGEPLGAEEIRLAKRRYGWPEEAKFLVPEGVYQHFAGGYRPARPPIAGDMVGRHRGVPHRLSSPRRPGRAAADGPAPRRLGRRSAQLRRRSKGNGKPRRLGQGAERHRPALPMADRRVGRPRAVDQDAPYVRGGGDFEAGNYGGRNLHFGIREHAMGAILNGLALSKVRALRLELPDLLRLHEAAHPD